MSPSYSFLLTGVAGEQAASAASLIATTADAGSFVLTSAFFAAQAEVLRADPELLEGFQRVHDAFVKGDPTDFREARRRLAETIRATPDQWYQAFVHRAIPHGPPRLRPRNPDAFASQVEKVLRKPLLVHARESQALQRFEEVLLVKKGPQGELQEEAGLSFEFFFTLDLVSDVETIVSQIIEALKIYPHRNLQVKIRGESRVTKDADTLAQVFTRALNAKLSSLLGLVYLKVEFLVGADPVKYEIYWSRSGEPQWQKADSDEELPFIDGALVQEVIQGPKPPPLPMPQYILLQIAGVSVRVEEVKGREGREVHCALPGETLTEGLTLQLLTSVLQAALAKFLKAERFTIDFSLGHIELKYPLAQTWVLVEQLPIDIFPLKREVKLGLRLSPDAQVEYGLFRGQETLRKAFYDGNGRWEVLEIHPTMGYPYNVLVHDVVRQNAKGEDVQGVEIHVDPYLLVHAGKELSAIFVDAASIVSQRKELGEIILVMEPPAGVSLLKMVGGMARKIFEAAPEYAGRIVVLVTKTGGQPDLVTEFSFDSSLSLKMRNNVSESPHPPRLYVPLERERAQVKAQAAGEGVSTTKEGGPSEPPHRSLRDILTRPLGDLFKS